MRRPPFDKLRTNEVLLDLIDTCSFMLSLSKHSLEFFSSLLQFSSRLAWEYKATLAANAE